MKTDSRLDIKRGTVLAIPLGKEQWALGQVIYPGTNFYLGIAPEVVENPLSSSAISGRELKLFSWTNDAEVYNNNWKNLGVHDLQPHPPLPEYRIILGGKESIESFTGDRTRDFDKERDEALQFRKIRSPLLVQDVVQAACGVGAWKPWFDQMLA